MATFEGVDFTIGEDGKEDAGAVLLVEDGGKALGFDNGLKLKQRLWEERK